MTTHKLARDVILLPSLHDTFQVPYCIMFWYAKSLTLLVN